MNRLILVLVDGLGHDTAVAEMGYLEGAVALGAARRWRMTCALPSVSRPLYETIHTGLTPHDHGVVSNDVVRPTTRANVFSLVREAGGRTGAAAYSWFSELYNGTPYDPVLGREADDETAAIQHGRFYTEDDTPDIEVLRDGAMLVRRFAPDYLLIHPMGCDHVGHVHGGTSPQYRRQAAKMDNLLSLHVPGWLDAGYTVAVTADHGMDADGRHGGTKPETTTVPFYLMGDGFGPRGDDGRDASQLSVAPTLVLLLGLPVPAAMTAPSLVEPTR